MELLENEILFLLDLDNDCNGFMDLMDPACAGSQFEPDEECGCGVAGAQGTAAPAALALLLLVGWISRRRP